MEARWERVPTARETLELALDRLWELDADQSARLAVAVVGGLLILWGLRQAARG